MSSKLGKIHTAKVTSETIHQIAEADRLWKEGGYPKAIQVYACLMKENPKQRRYMFRIAHCYYKMNDYRKAIVLYMLLSFQSILNPYWNWMIAYCLLELGLPSCAAPYLALTIQLANNTQFEIDLKQNAWAILEDLYPGYLHNGSTKDTGSTNEDQSEIHTNTSDEWTDFFEGAVRDMFLHFARAETLDESSLSNHEYLLEKLRFHRELFWQKGCPGWARDFLLPVLILEPNRQSSFIEVASCWHMIRTKSGADTESLFPSNHHLFSKNGPGNTDVVVWAISDLEDIACTLGPPLRYYVKTLSALLKQYTTGS